MTQRNELLKVGLIGVGKWGAKIARTIREELPGLHLHRAVTKKLEAQKDVGAQCTLHNKWQELFTGNDIDALILAIPPRYNCEVACVALNRHIPVFIEKPMACNSADALEILNVAIQNQGIAEVDHIDLFNPVFCKMKRSIHEPIKKIFARIGAPYERRSDIPPLWEYAPHFIAATLALMGKMPIAVKGNYLPRETPPFQDPSKEIVQIVFDFGDGSDVCIEAGNGMNKKVRSLDVFLESKMFHFEDCAANPLSSSDMFNPGQKVSIVLPSDTLPLTAALQCFEFKVREGKHNVAGVEMGVKVVTLLEAVTQSLETHDWSPVTQPWYLRE